MIPSREKSASIVILFPPNNREVCLDRRCVWEHCRKSSTKLAKSLEVTVGKSPTLVETYLLNTTLVDTQSKLRLNIIYA
jgi:hypothetical protein